MSTSGKAMIIAWGRENSKNLCPHYTLKLVVELAASSCHTMVRRLLPATYHSSFRQVPIAHHTHCP
jgi:hypothetical protein